MVVVPGSPVFLADGFGRTEVSQNLYGGGAVAVDTASGPMYNTGLDVCFRLCLGFVHQAIVTSTVLQPRGSGGRRDGWGTCML